ncbi:MAG: pyridoxal phosphate-dependent aminotransferase [Bacteroidetes bacterium]|uniref:Aminotransferase n=1 Tax=Candidatus Egerieousia excrementavium TaxID=2840778 RepID=A0A9D9GY73_9BACT|nr:pyridoxal phosphate-dependent aminotransferase [Candidatus Egerieousia excrementavium]
MLSISKKAQILPASPIRKLVPFADAAKKRGIKVYHLNIGQPDIDSPKEVIDAIRNIDLKYLAYANSAGIESYRKGLAQYYNNLGINVDYTDIIVTTSGSEAVNFAISVTCDEGDEVIVMEPFYTNYNSFAVQNGIKLVPISTTIENGFQLPPVEEFEKYITPKTRAILICNPGNPTGTLYSKESLIKLGDIVKRHGIYLLSDEVYREFCYTDTPHFSCMQIGGIEDNVILLDSVSKRYSMCGARIGAIVSKNKEIMKHLLKYAQARLCSPVVEQIAAEAALKTPKAYFDAVKAEYIHRRDVMIDLLNKIPGVYTPKPMGAFYTIVDLPVDDADKFAQWLLEEFQYEGQTVMVAPAAGFYATPGKGTTQVRMAYVLKVEDIRAAIKCLEEALKVYPGRK